MGAPAKVVRQITDEELAFLPKSAANYVQDAMDYYSYVSGPAKLGKNLSDLESFTDDEYGDNYEEGENK
jgi:hypothetical protein